MKSACIMLAVVLLTANAKSQGCSDAGFCSVGSLQPNHENRQWTSSLALSQTFGIGENNTFISVSKLEANYQIGGFLSIDISIPVYGISGDLANLSGFGDIQGGVSYHHADEDETRYSVTLGGKIAVNNADRSVEGKPLPMPYQTSLGTNDLILGAAVQSGSWSFSVGYQHPFGESGNAFTHAAWENDPAAVEFAESVGLNRRPDILLRVEKQFDLSPVRLFTGILPIYHLGRDEIRLGNAWTTVDGSEGLTFNINAGAAIPLADDLILSLIAAMPLKTRAVRTDGLTRSFVGTGSISYRF